MPAATQIAATQMTMNGARYQVLFCSALLQQFGILACVDRMAQEFGEHPDTAAKRMLWARQLIAQGPHQLTQSVPAPPERWSVLRPGSSLLVQTLPQPGHQRSP